MQGGFSPRQGLQWVGRELQAADVLEMMESARRWSGYVCPDCRFVFRVPRDHDGQGVVCTSCRRILKIPTGRDHPPALLAQRTLVEPEDAAPVSDAPVLRTRRRGKGHVPAEDHTWDQQAEFARSGGAEGRQMRRMLVGGSVLFAMIVGGVVFALKAGGKFPTAARQPNPAPVAPSPAAAAAPGERAAVAVLAEAIPLARKFLEAKTVAELLPLIRHPQITEPRLRAFHPEGKIVALGMSEFNVSSEISRRDEFISLLVTTVDHAQKPMAFIETPAGLKIDWESWVGWSEMAWDAFLAARPTTGKDFRVKISLVEYYNFGFSDESKWQSYRLASADGSQAIYGYVEKGSVIDLKLRPVDEGHVSSVILTLKFPAEATSSSQVEIERFVVEGWVKDEPK